jgi:hypothetical protein
MTIEAKNLANQKKKEDEDYQAPQTDEDPDLFDEIFRNLL